MGVGVCVCVCVCGLSLLMCKSRDFFNYNLHFTFERIPFL